jgi:hypothetical protein
VKNVTSKHILPWYCCTLSKHKDNLQWKIVDECMTEGLIILCQVRLFWITVTWIVITWNLLKHVLHIFNVWPFCLAKWHHNTIKPHLDSDHQPAHSPARVARCGASGTGGALDTASSWRGGSVDVDYLHLEGGDEWCVLHSLPLQRLPHGPQSLCYSCRHRRWHVVWTRRGAPHRESCRRVTGLFATWSNTDFLPLP